MLHGLSAAVARLVRQAEAVTPVVAAAKASGAAASTAGDGSGPWWPAIEVAAAANGIWAEGLTRLMLAESGGSATASNGVDEGLFQYAPGTWKGSWNPGVRRASSTAPRRSGPPPWPSAWGTDPPGGRRPSPWPSPASRRPAGPVCSVLAVGVVAKRG